MSSPQIALSCVVLAAGKGTRMKSELPKVMHPLGDLPLVTYPVQVARDVGADPVVVVTGHGREMVEGYLSARFGSVVAFVRQEEQLGTAHAVAQAAPVLRDFPGIVLLLYGDVPLVPRATLEELRDALSREPEALLALATTSVDEPPAYGRIIRDDQGQVRAIREDKDCSAAERAIKEVNPGLYAVRAHFLFGSLARIDQQNAQGEFYLTDLVALAARQGPVPTVPVDFEDVMGVNDRADLARVEARRQAAQRLTLMRAGVTMLAPETLWLGAEVEIGPDCELGPNVVLRGRTVLGAGSRIEAGSVLQDCELGEQCQVGPHCVLRGQKLIAGQRLPAGTMR